MWRWVRWMFLASAAVSLGYVAFSFADAELFQAYESWKLSSTSKPSATAVQPKMLTVSSASVTVPRVDVVAGSVLGRLEISRIGISVIVAEGIDGRTLRRAVGHIPGTAFPGETGNVAISGHRDTFFRPLKDIQTGDEITLTTTEGSYRYRVDSLRVVAEDEMSVLDES